MSGVWEDLDDKTITIDVSQSNRTKKLSTKPSLTGAEYTQKLRELYTNFHQPSWTSQLQGDSSLSKLFQTSKSILSDKTLHLLPRTIEITQLPHANTENYSKSVITAAQFQNNLLLIGGKDKRLRIFEVPGEEEKNLKSLAYFKDLPITNAQFCDNKIYVSGDKPHFYVYDMPKEDFQRVPYVHGYSGQPLGKMKISPDSRYLVYLGNNGKIMIVSTQSQQLICEFKMNSISKGLCFLDDHTLAAGGDEGDVYIWDIGMRQCVKRFSDEGTIKITCLEANDNYLAVGSNTGVVNVYNLNSEEYKLTEPKPIKSVMNLTTTVEGLAFNSTNEILAMHSRWKRDAFKLLHIPSMTVFSNWPSFKDHLKFPMTCAFNSTSELLTIGNDEGMALLYRLNHYPQ